MKTKLFLGFVSMLFVITIVALSLAAEHQKDQASQEVPSIEGTYKLIVRKLPDGTLQGPPDVKGLLTYTKNYRNFNVMWKDAEGKFFSFSYVATYKLTATEYSETSIFSITNDQIGGKWISYDTSGQSGSSPVTVGDGRLHFKLPLYNEPWVVFKGNYMTAIAPGFIDVWEKVQ